MTNDLTKSIKSKNKGEVGILIEDMDNQKRTQEMIN